MTPPRSLPKTVFASMALSLTLVWGCGQTGADREQRISTEQAAIQSYSSKIPEAIRYQSAFADEWRRVNEIKDLKAYGDAMRSRVIPALEKYVAALRMMPASTDKLGEIHSKVTKAYEGAVAGFSVFLEGLTDENVEERYRSLLKTMETVAHAEKTYRRHLGTYYAANRVILNEPQAAPAPTADAPTATPAPKAPEAP